jgi:hypothetical protein
MHPLRFSILRPHQSLLDRCGGDFNTFVSNISAEAAAAGISQGVINSALWG